MSDVVVEVGEQGAQFGEAPGAELLFPFDLDLVHDVAHRACCSVSAAGEGDALEALVVGVVAALEVAVAFELPEEVVERLLAHAGASGELGGAQVVGSGPLQNGQVGGAEVGEAPLVQSGEHSLQDGFPGHAQERADEWRAVLAVNVFE